MAISAYASTSSLINCAALPPLHSLGLTLAPLSTYCRLGLGDRALQTGHLDPSHDLLTQAAAAFGKIAVAPALAHGEAAQRRLDEAASGLLGAQTGLDVAQAFTIGQLREGHA